MHLIVIYSTRSGRKQKRIRSRIEGFYSKREVSYELLNYNHCDWNHVKEVCSADENTRIVVAAGDGTLRRVLEFMWKNNLLKHSVAFIPMGSGNIAAYSLELPLNTMRALEKSVTGVVRRLDLGLLNDKHIFFIAAGLGRLANLSVLTERSLKRRYGALAYILRIPSVIAHDYKKERFEINIDDDSGNGLRKIKTHSLMVVNHLNLSMLQPRRGIMPDDGKLDVFTLHNGDLLGLIRAVFEFYRTRGSSSVLTHTRISQGKYELKGFKGHVHLDGDEMSYPHVPLEFKVLKGAVSFIV